MSQFKNLFKFIESIDLKKNVNDFSVSDFPDFLSEAKLALNSLDISSSKETTVRTFLNRILGCKVKLQNLLFNLFESLLEAEITLAKMEHRYYEGIFDIDYSKSLILNHNFQTYQLTDKRKVYLQSLSVKNGIAWNNIYKIFLNYNANSNVTKNRLYYPI